MNQELSDKNKGTNITNHCYRIAVIMTVHNRLSKTLECLNRLSQQNSATIQYTFHTYFMDDGSEDDTSCAVSEKYSNLTLMQGNGDLFWNRGMHEAFGAAISGGYDFYLWLNNDTNLFTDALERLLMAWKIRNDAGHPCSIIVGATKDPNTGLFSYGGYLRLNSWILRLQHVKPTDQLEQCTTMGGNCVLIPKSVVERTGNIDPFYRHRWGDVDYGLRAGNAGATVWLCPGYIAECEENPISESWTDESAGIIDRVIDFHSIKGYGKRDWLHYVHRHGGILWPLLWAKPYLDIVITSFTYSVSDLYKRIRKPI